MADNERQFEMDIESFLISDEGGWKKATDAGYRNGFQYDNDILTENYALDISSKDTSISMYFICKLVTASPYEPV